MEERNEIEIDGEFFEDVSKSYIQNLKFEKSFNLLQRAYAVVFELITIAAQPIDKRSWRDKQERKGGVILFPTERAIIPETLSSLPGLKMDKSIPGEGNIVLNPITIDLDSIDGESMIKKAIENKDINIITED